MLRDRRQAHKPPRRYRRHSSPARRLPVNEQSARPTRRAASCWCDRGARRRVCSARPGATTRPASGCRTAAAPSSPPARARDAEHDQAEGPVARSERRLPARRRREGPDLFPPLQLRAVSESAEPRRDLRRRVRQHEDDPAAPGHPAAEVLRAVLGMVPHAEDALLPLRLVVEPVAGRSGAGRRRGQPDLDLQPVRERRRRHHLAAVRAKHRGPVPVLARRGRSPDRRRVLPRLVHLRRLAQGRVHTTKSSTRRCSPTT